jgi:membrane-bound lytic murein transglycosylase A
MSRFPFLLAAGLIGALMASCASSRVGGETTRVADTANLTLAPGDYRELPGWSDDRLAPAIAAFVKSCARLPQGSDDAPLDPAAQQADFGRVGDWRPLCRIAEKSPANDEAAARQFFESHFVPALVGSKGTSNSLFTGYWEVELNGSPSQGDAYQVPVYRRPPDLVDNQPYLDRGAIEDGALKGRGLEAVWLTSPDDLFVLQTQGSGRIRLPDGSMMRLVYEANNGRKPVDIYKLMHERGLIPEAQFSENTVRAWMRDNPDKAAALRRENPEYVFFQPLKGDGPLGFQGAVLTPERSLAVDHSFIPLGAPLWLDAQDKYRPVAVRRLVVAQDTGDGITGPLRGDFYWGSGLGAVARGADFYADGRYWVLLPKKIAARMMATLK